MHAASVSIESPSPSGSPMRDTAPLASQSGLTGTFSGVLEPSTSLCACLRIFGVFSWLSSPSGRSVCYVRLPIGESGSFQSIWRILTCLCVPPAIFAYTSSPCTSIPVFGVLTWLLGLTWSRLPAPTGESRVFDAFRLVLIVSFRFCSSVRAVANDCHVPVPS